MPIAAGLILAAAASSGCSKKVVPPLQLDSGRLTVTNTTAQDWTHIEIWVNRLYRLTVPSIPAGQQFQAPLSIFIEAYGHRFDFSKQQIKDLRLSAKNARGEPVGIIMEFRGSGLAGVGVFKGKEGKD
jgi:hypothetical protein